MPYALVDFDKVQVFINSVAGNPEAPLWAGSNTQYKFDVSRVAELTIHIFIRDPNSPPGACRTGDICLGVVRLNPRFNTQKPSDADADSKDRNQGNEFSGIGWVDMQYGTGRLQIGVDYTENQGAKLAIDNFELLKVVM